MLLNRLFLFAVVFMGVGCADTAYTNKSAYRVDLKNKSGQQQIRKLEGIMLKNDINRIEKVTINYNGNYIYAADIRERLISDYGIKSTLQAVRNADVNVSVVVQNRIRTPASCYQFSVDDYDWYKSSYAEMKEYEESTICPITIDD